MSIEDDMANMFKHVNFTNMMDPLKMLKMMQLSVLKQMKAVIDDQIKNVSRKETKTPFMDLDPFKILDIEKTATWEDVERAYREKAAQHHPDKGGDNMEMIKINAAYEVLKKVMGGDK